jgi:hypothetical protein
MVTKKTTGKKNVKKLVKNAKTTAPKPKVVYRTKTVYVTRRERAEPKDNSVFGEVMPMVKTGMGAIIGIGVAKGIADAFK